MINFLTYIENLAIKGGYAEYALIILALIVIIITIERTIFLSIELTHYKKNRWLENITLDEIINSSVISPRINQYGIFYHIMSSFTSQHTTQQATQQAKQYDFSIIENIASQQIRKLEAGLSLLKLIAGISPLVGILGTILGIMDSFGNMVSNQEGSHFQLDNIANGISIALITTATGLIIAIATIFLHFLIQSYANFFINKIEFLISRIENAVENNIVNQQENSFKHYS